MITGLGVATDLFRTSVLSVLFLCVLGATSDLLPPLWYDPRPLSKGFKRKSETKKETKRRTLEELGYVFAVSTGKHASHHLNTFLPYRINP